MNGPSNIDRKTLGDRLSRREFWGEVFGWTVGAGLLIEYWKDIADCVVKKQPPSLQVIGGILVTLGVLGEVWCSRLAQKMTDEISERADSDVANANKQAADALERAGRAELGAAEANLARIKLEERLAPRKLSEDAIAELASVLSQYSGRRVDVVIYDAHVSEVLILGESIDKAFSLAGWETHLSWISGGFRVRDEAGVTLTVAQERTRAEERDFESIALDLIPALSKHGVASSFFVGGFSKTQPLTVVASPEWILEDVAIFRVQVGQKLL